MSTVFHRPAWIDGLTEVFARALPEGFEPVDAVAERHGSWQWTARSDDSPDGGWLFASVTPLPTRMGDSGDGPHPAAVAAWQLTPNAAAIDESTLVHRRLTGSRATQAALSRALAEAVQGASASTPPAEVAAFKELERAKRQLADVTRRTRREDERAARAAGKTIAEETPSAEISVRRSTGRRAAKK